MAQATAEEQAALNEVMQLLEVAPDTTEPTGNDIPAKREKLAILVSTSKAKEAIGVQLTHEQVKRLSKRTWRSTTNGRKPTSAARQPSPSSIPSSCSSAKAWAWWLRLTMSRSCSKTSRTTTSSTTSFPPLRGGLALRCGRWLALANAALITTKHIKLESEPEQPDTTHPSRDSEGYPLEGLDDVCSA